ncbi:MAG TPA: 3-carboxy-cis,cis-muconate cycloisomerase [Burkholderiaceae bacterium]
MAASVVDSSVLGNLFSTGVMREVWSDRSRTRRYLEFERALATVQGRAGMIPPEAAAEIARCCDVDLIDMDELRVQTERVGFPVVGLVSQLTALCRDGLGEYAHWGATTQDVTDTATVLQVRDSLELVAADLAALSATLAKLARRYRDTPVIGRTNMQQAIPVTFGFKMASILAGVERHRERLAQLRPRVLVCEFAGACGTLASIEGDALGVQAALAAELGLGNPDIGWHSVRDSIAEVGAFLALVGGSLGKIATDVRMMMQTEVGEVAEPFAPGRGSSSTMPHKRNPVSCAFIHSSVSMVRHHAAALVEAMVGEHERSTGPWEIEWIALPEAFCLLSGALAHTRFVLDGLEVNEARMRENIGLTNGLVMAEAAMMGLAPHIGREVAHDLVYDLCREAIERREPLIERLAAHPEVSKHLDRAALERLLDPASYLGQAGAMVDRVLARNQNG